MYEWSSTQRGIKGVSTFQLSGVLVPILTGCSFPRSKQLTRAYLHGGVFLTELDTKLHSKDCGQNIPECENSWQNTTTGNDHEVQLNCEGVRGKDAEGEKWVLQDGGGLMHYLKLLVVTQGLLTATQVRGLGLENSQPNRHLVPVDHGTEREEEKSTCAGRGDNEDVMQATMRTTRKGTDSNSHQFTSHGKYLVL